MPRLSYTAPLAAILLAASSAHAQAQPAFDDAPPGMCSCTAPAAVAAVVPALPRWSVGLRLTSSYTVDKDTNDKTDWSGASIDGYFRIAPRWELGLELGGGGDHDPVTGAKGELLMSMELAMARFHPWPYARWDLYAVGGLGGAVIRNVDGPARDPDRTVGTLGFGVERRFGHLAVSLELRSFGLSAPRQSDAQPEAAAMTTTTTPAAPLSSGALDGGSFSLAASYEF